VTTISFLIYVVCRVIGGRRPARRHPAESPVVPVRIGP
jgi:hypothetical protein